MARLALRGRLLADPRGIPHEIEAVLFDKDGTLSISEPMLKTLAEARVFACVAMAAERHPALLNRCAAGGMAAGSELESLLRRAYGLSESGLHPAGTIAVGSRNHNLISTATVLSQVGLGWPEALELSQAVFAATDGQHGMGSQQPPQPTSGLQALLKQLVAAGVRCAVISNDDVAGIEAFLNSHNLAASFAGLWSAEHRPCKPDPAAVHGLCSELGIAPNRCALVGDANSDLRMARAAGVSVVLGYTAAWGTPPRLDAGFSTLAHWHELQVMAGPGGSQAAD